MKIEEIINVGYGFRLLRIGEQCRAGDEYLCDMKGWLPRIGLGEIKETWYPTRRKIDPGEGWELVPEHEATSDMLDFFCGEAGRWNSESHRCLACACGRSPREMIDDTRAYPGVLAFRRRIAPKAEPVNQCAAEEPRVYAIYRADDGFKTEKEAREAIEKRFRNGDHRDLHLMKAVSKFTCTETKSQEIKETKIQ
jgi:hypothetical protein